MNKTATKTNDMVKTVGIVALSASAVVISSVYVYSNIIKDNTTTKTPVVSAQVTPTVKPYKDGSYKAAGNYITNNGVISHKMEVTVAVADGVITAASTELKDDKVSDNAKKSNDKFNLELKTTVVGKKFEEAAAVGKIAGSSDTTRGFVEGLELIKVQAMN